jgi:hypothetical protein
VKLDTTELDIGLVPPKKSSILSHVVHPIPDRLLTLVWDFGQLSEEDELSHISTMTRSECLFNYAETGISSSEALDKQIPPNPSPLIRRKEMRLTMLIFKCHNTVRMIEERSGVSLRDVKRVFIFFRWFLDQLRLIDYYVNNDPELNAHKQKYWMIRNANCRELAAAICGVTICYYLRLNGREAEQFKIRTLIFNWTMQYSGMEQLSAAEIADTLSQVSQLYLYNLKQTTNVLRSDVTLNVPFKENFISLLACISVRVPLVIVGAPGTSKTLSANTVLDALDHRNNSDLAVADLFASFDKIIKLYFGGSETSTSEGVTKVFDKADKLYQQKIERQTLANSRSSPAVKGEIKIDTPLIFFDELGLAEQSEFNPLKVMHSRLEENLGRIPFVGISNWKPDQSKLNRMVCLYRPDLSRDDIISIFASSLGKLESAHRESLMPLFEILAESYLLFRKWQRSIKTVSPCYHSNFHGSRDIYATFRSVYTLMEQHKNISLTSTIDQHREYIITAIFRAVERNLNGESYIFSFNDLTVQGKGSGVLSSSCLQRVEGSDGQTIDMISPAAIEDILPDRLKKELRIYKLQDLANPYSPLLSVNAHNETDLLEHLGQQYSLSSAEIFKMIFTSRCSGKVQMGIRDPPLQELLLLSLADPHSRFLLLRPDSLLSENLLIGILRRGCKDSNKLIDWRNCQKNNRGDELLSYLKTYISMGYTVIMKNLDSLYGGLYDLFNQRYQTINGRNCCHLYYGQTKHTVEVHPSFKCIVLLDHSSSPDNNNGIEAVCPAPFLNRFEKYYIQLSRILTQQDFEAIAKARIFAADLSAGRSSNVLALSEELILSSAIDENNLLTPFSSPIPDKTVEMRIMALTTSQYYLGSPLSPSLVSLYQSTHEMRSLNDVLDRYSLFAHSSPFDDDVKEDSADMLTDRLTVLTFSPPSDIREYIQSIQSENISVLTGEYLSSVNMTDRMDVLPRLSLSPQSVLICLCRDIDDTHLFRQSIDNSPVQRVVMIVPLGGYRHNRPRDTRINYWQGWSICTIEDIIHPLSIQSLEYIRSTPVSQAVLQSNNEPSGIGKWVWDRAIQGELLRLKVSIVPPITINSPELSFLIRTLTDNLISLLSSTPNGISTLPSIYSTLHLNDDYRKPSHLLALAFSSLFSPQIRVYMDTLDSLLSNLSSTVKGLIHFSNNEYLLSEFHTWLSSCALKAANPSTPSLLPQAPKTNHPRPRPLNPSARPLVYSLPFQTLYSPLVSLLANIQQEHTFQPKLLSRACTDYIRTVSSPSTPDEPASLLSTLLKEEFNVLTILSKLLHELQAILRSAKPRLDLSDQRITSPLLSDLFKTLFPKVFPADCPPETIQEFIRLANTLRCNGHSIYKDETLLLGPSPIVPALLCLCFPDISTLLLAHHSALSAYNPTPQSSVLPTAVDYRLLSALSAHLSKLSLTPLLSPQAPAPQPSSNPHSVSLLEATLHLLAAFTSSPDHPTLSDDKALYLWRLQREPIEPVATAVFSQYLTLTIDPAPLGLFLRAWPLHTLSFDLFLQTPNLFSLPLPLFQHLANSLSSAFTYLLDFTLSRYPHLVNILTLPPLPTPLASLDRLISYLFSHPSTPQCICLLQYLLDSIIIHSPSVSTLPLNTLAQAMHQYASTLDSPGLLLFASILAIRLSLSDPVLHRLLPHRPPHPSPKDLSPILDPLLHQGDILDACLHPQAHPLVYLLQNIYRLHGNIDIAEPIPTVSRILHASFDPTDPTRIAIFNDNILTMYTQLEQSLPQAIHLNSVQTNPDNLQRVLTLAKGNQGNKANAYVVGLLGINTLLALTPASDIHHLQRTRSSWHSTLNSLISMISKDSPLHGVVYLLVTISTPTQHMPIDCRLAKMQAHQALITILSSPLPFTPKSTITQSAHLLPVVVTDKLTNYADRWDHTLDNRLNDPDYHHNWGPAFPPNLGVYLCQCKFMYTFGQCGYPMNTANCVNCKRQVGGNNHIPLPGMTHVNTIESIHALIEQEYKQNKDTYPIHVPFTKESIPYINARAVTLPASMRSRNSSKKSLQDQHVYMVFKHLMDHLSLYSQELLIPQSSLPAFNSQWASLLLASPLPAPHRSKASTPQDYLLLHIRSDLDTLHHSLHFPSPQDGYTWLSSLQSMIAEEIVSNTPSPVDPFILLPLPATTLLNTQQILSMHTHRLTLLASPTHRQTAHTLRLLYTQRIDLSDRNIPLPNPAKTRQLSLLFRPISFNKDDLHRRLNDMALSPTLPRYALLQSVIKSRPVVRAYRSILCPILSLTQYLTRSLSSRLSLEDATTRPLLPSPDPLLPSLHHQYTLSTQLLQSIRSTHPQLLQFRFMCQLDIDLDQYLINTSDPTLSKIIDYLIVDIDLERYNGNNYIYYKAMIQSLAENFQNSLVKLAHAHMLTVDPSTPPPREIKIREAVSTDFIALPFDLEDIISQDIGIGENGWELQLDRALHLTAKALSSFPILLTDESNDNLPFFKFDTGVRADPDNDLPRFFSYMSSQPLDGELSRYISSLQASSVRSVLALVTDICNLLHQTLTFSDQQSSIIDLLSKSTTERDYCLKLLSEARTLKLPRSLNLSKIESFYHTLRSTDIDIYLQEHYSSPLSSNLFNILQGLNQPSDLTSQPRFRQELHKIWTDFKDMASDLYPRIDGKSLSTPLLDILPDSPSEDALGDELCAFLSQIHFGQAYCLRTLVDAFPLPTPN